MIDFNIDVVIPWVDSNDAAWREEKEKYTPSTTFDRIDDRDARYRDWGIIRYLLRSIEMYMPWVNKVFFLTWGHTPEWMNKSSAKLRIIRHKDYIPEEYLPTYCSHTIELNMHRIDELSEHFIYFNDDYLVLSPLSKEFFFHENGLPKDYLIINPINSSSTRSVQDIALTGVQIANQNFDYHKTRSLRKMVSYKYGKYLFRSLFLMSWPYYIGFLGKHQTQPYLKSVLSEVWDREYTILDSTCRHRFRTRGDVNQWVFRYWQLASGRFEPTKPYGQLFTLSNTNNELYETIKKSKQKTIAINDNGSNTTLDYNRVKEELVQVLEKKYPEKSNFEK